MEFLKPLLSMRMNIYCSWSMKCPRSYVVPLIYLSGMWAKMKEKKKFLPKSPKISHNLLWSSPFTVLGAFPKTGEQLKAFCVISLLLWIQGCSMAWMSCWKTVLSSSSMALPGKVTPPPWPARKVGVVIDSYTCRRQVVFWTVIRETSEIVNLGTTTTFPDIL